MNSFPDEPRLVASAFFLLLRGCDGSSAVERGPVFFLGTGPQLVTE
jgi:hypothetical protein